MEKRYFHEVVIIFVHVYIHKSDVIKKYCRKVVTISVHLYIHKRSVIKSIRTEGISLEPIDITEKE